MIRSFGHRGLKLYFTHNDDRELPRENGTIKNIRRALDHLDYASRPEDMNLPQFRFHELKGPLAGTYAVKVGGRWRMTFNWTGNDATRVDLTPHDY